MCVTLETRGAFGRIPSRARSIRWQRIREFRLRGLGCAIAIHEDTNPSISLLRFSLSLSLSLPSSESTNTPFDRSRIAKEKIRYRGCLPPSILKLDSATNNNGRILLRGTMSRVEECNTFCYSASNKNRAIFTSS